MREHQAQAVHVADLNFLTADDAVIFRAAQTAGIQVVLSKDEDFVNLLERHGPPPQVVWITRGNVRNAELRALVSGAWPRVAQLLQSGEPLVEIGRRTAIQPCVPVDRGFYRTRLSGGRCFGSPCEPNFFARLAEGRDQRVETEAPNLAA